MSQFVVIEVLEIRDPEGETQTLIPYQAI